MSDTQAWNVRVPAAAARSIGKVPERYRRALVEFIYGGLAENPERRGKRLRPPHDDKHGARRGDFRVLYELDQETRTLTVLRVAGRADAFRSD